MPPVSSRTQRTSKPSGISSFFTGEAWVRAGRQDPGRRFAKRPKCFRKGRRAPRSGWISGGRFSHLGPPTEPKRIASAFSQASMVSCGRGVSLLVPSSAAPPTRCSERETSKENFSETASRTLRASTMTSGPMPSPERMVIVWDMRGFIGNSGILKGEIGCWFFG